MGHNAREIDIGRLVKKWYYITFSVAQQLRKLSLNENGFHTPLGRCFTKHSVNWIRFKYQIPGPSGPVGSFSVTEVATRFGVSMGVVYYWLKHGIIKGYKQFSGWPWKIVIDEVTANALVERIHSSKHIKQRVT